MDLNSKLNEEFIGKVVRKDLTKSIKEGANVPIYVLEYLLGMYCATDNEELIFDRVAKVHMYSVGKFAKMIGVFLLVIIVVLPNNKKIIENLKTQ